MSVQKFSEDPKLSVVICVVSDAIHLEGCLNALENQLNAPPFEVIVPYPAQDTEIRDLTQRFPDVKFLPIERLRFLFGSKGASREHHDELRAKGIKIAQGDIVALLEDHGRADRYWAKNITEAHKDSHVAIGGAIENEVDRPLNWAVYYCDFGRYQNPVKSGPTLYISDANISYKRSHLERIKNIWQEAFHETTVNATLMAKGEVLWLSEDIIVFQHRESLSLIAALRERYVWGRSFAGTRAQDIAFVNRLIYLGLSPTLPFILMARKIRNALAKRRFVGKFIQAMPLTFLLTCFWSLGEFMGYLTNRQNRFIR